MALPRAFTPATRPRFARLAPVYSNCPRKRTVRHAHKVPTPDQDEVINQCLLVPRQASQLLLIGVRKEVVFGDDGFRLRFDTEVAD